jgi:hypothetical protein
MEKQTFNRTGAICAGVGAVVTVVSWGIHPEITDPAGYLPIVAGSSHFVGIHWGLIIGMVLMQFGLAAVTLALREQPAPNDAGGWAQSGFYALLVGLALWIGVFMTEVALKPLADGLRTDPTLTSGALALSGLQDAGATAASFVYSLGVALLGTALLVSRRFPRWIGASGLVLGAVTTLGLGLPRMFLGKSVWTEKLGSPIFGTLVLVWVFMLGVMLWRMGGAGQRQAPGARATAYSSDTGR